MLSRCWRWIAELLGLVQAPLDTAGFMARVHGLDRRRHVRIKIPNVPSPIFPRLGVNQVSLPIVDLSVGGACVQDRQDRLSTEVGHNVKMDLMWHESREDLSARIVAFSQHVNRHLQFQDLSAGLLTKLSLLVRAGAAGQRMRLVPVPKDGPARLDQAVELWTGLSGDNLFFHARGERFAEMTCLAHTIAFFNDGDPLVMEGSSGDQRSANSHELADVLVFLVNIPQPSPRVIRLINILAAHSQQWLNTGSGS